MKGRRRMYYRKKDEGEVDHKIYTEMAKKKKNVVLHKLLREVAQRFSKSRCAPDAKEFVDIVLVEDGELELSQLVRSKLEPAL